MNLLGLTNFIGEPGGKEGEGTNERKQRGEKAEGDGVDGEIYDMLHAEF